MSAASRKGKIPQRTCVACREVRPKRELTRIVGTDDGIKIDPTGRQNGRGAYLCTQRGCWEKAAKSDLIANALRSSLSNDARYALLSYANKLSESVPTAG